MALKFELILLSIIGLEVLAVIFMWEIRIVPHVNYAHLLVSILISCIHAYVELLLECSVFFFARSIYTIGLRQNQQHQCLSKWELPWDKLVERHISPGIMRLVYALFVPCSLLLKEFRCIRSKHILPRHVVIGAPWWDEI